MGGYGRPEGAHRLDDVRGDAEQIVELLVDGLGCGSAADGKDVAIGGGQVDGDHLVGGELFADRAPGSVEPAVAKGLLDGHQQVVSEHAQEDVRLHSLLEVMEDRPLSERALRTSAGVSSITKETLNDVRRDALAYTFVRNVRAHSCVQQTPRVASFFVDLVLVPDATQVGGGRGVAPEERFELPTRRLTAVCSAD